MLIFIFWAIFVLATWAVAKHNGRNEVLAVVIAMLLGGFALIGYLIAGKSFAKKLEEASLMAKATKGELT